MQYDYSSFARLWQLQVWDQSSEIDPDDEFVWRGVALGWAIGQGMPLDQAKEFVNYLNVKDLV